MLEGKDWTVNIQKLLSGWAVFRSMVTPATKLDLIRLEEKIMAKQSEAAAKLQALAVQLNKVKTEVQKLKDAVENADNVSPELEAAINAVDAAVNGVDEINPDEPVTPPVEPS